MYRKIANALQQQIESGELPPGEQLPSEKELATTWSVSESTVKTAISELRKAEQVRTVSKKGTFVAEQREPFYITLSNVDLGSTGNPTGAGLGGGEGQAFVEEAQRQGHSAHFTTPEVKIRKATKAEIKALGIPADRPRPQVVGRSQERFVDGKPHSLQTSYFDLDLAKQAPLLFEEEDIEEGTVNYLAAIGRSQSGYIDEFVGRPPADQERAFFGLPKQSAVLEISRTAYDQNRLPFRLTVTVYQRGVNAIRFITGEVPDHIWPRPPR
ncbi:GntR family transcriptional regulator [Actinomadura barringtoniae]|nr:GntR family transcriptional regulator [Actinomadura barringtoniae]